MKSWFEKKFFQWIAKRSPVSDKKTLTQRNVYIFPTKEGAGFAALLLLLLLTAINYQSSLIYLFTFMLGSVFVFSIIVCFKNLSGLQLWLVDTNECFVGEEAVFSFTLKSKPNQYCESLYFSLPIDASHRAESPPLPVIKKIDVANAEVSTLELTKIALKRGEMTLGRVRLETTYPLGLIKAWTWLTFKKSSLVFPKPLKGVRSLSDASRGDDDDEGVVVRGEEEVSGLKDYAQGDSPNRIAWKHYASKGELYVKELVGASSSTCWLNYSDYASGNSEQRLSYLCHDVLDFNRKGLRFGMVYPGGVIEPSLGEQHKLACLRALALV